MNTKAKSNKRKPAYAALITVLLATSMEAGAETVVNLCVAETSMTMPDGGTVAMWGYGNDAGGVCNATVPGPRITLPVGESLLTINLRNALPAGTEGVSVMIPGLAGTTAPAPVFFTDGQGRQRVSSMAPVTAPGATVQYQFASKPGTYLYQSGTHPAVQVQMGLYGAVTQDAATGAYEGVPYDNEVMMLYSEIDPALHTAVAGGVYGTAAYPSAINYQPKYFLVNGESYTAATPDMPAGAAGQTTLIRFMNAGLESHAPFLTGLSMNIVAESGNAYPYPRRQHSMLLAAGQTRDAVIEAAADGRYPVSDRRLRNGLMRVLAVGPAAPAGSAPVAVDDAAATSEDAAVIISVALNDTDADGAGNINPASVAVVSQPLNGAATGNGDGTVTYTPNANFNGSDIFTYNIRDMENNLSNTATVTITVTPINDSPVAADDGYNATQDTALVVAAPGVQANDSDVDGDGLTALVQSAPANGGVIMNSDGSFTYTPVAGYTGTDSFTYLTSDGVANSNIATVTITVSPAVNSEPVAQDDFGEVLQNVGALANSVTIEVLANDTDADGTLDPGSVTIVTQPRKGTVAVNGDGSVTYTPGLGKRGSDTFGYTVNDNQGATSNIATVRINIIR